MRPFVGHQVPREQHSGLLRSLQHGGWLAEAMVLQLLRILLIDTRMRGPEPDDRYAQLLRVVSEMPGVVEVTIVLHIALRGASEVHDNRRSIEVGSLREGQLGTLTITEPVVVLQRQLTIAHTPQAVNPTQGH